MACRSFWRLRCCCALPAPGERRRDKGQAPLLTVSGAVTQTVTAEALAALPAAGDGETQGFSLTELMRLLGVPYYSRVTLTGDTGEPVEIYGYGLFTLRDGAALDYSGGMELDPDVTGVTAMDIGTRRAASSTLRRMQTSLPSRRNCSVSRR